MRGEKFNRFGSKTGNPEGSEYCYSHGQEVTKFAAFDLPSTEMTGHALERFDPSLHRLELTHFNSYDALRATITSIETGQELWALHSTEGTPWRAFMHGFGTMLVNNCWRY